MNRAFGEDNTKYVNTSVSEMIMERQLEKGVQIRSIQYAIERIKADPEFAKYAVFKPGPLSNNESYIEELAGVYQRGLMEVDQWIQDSLEKENAI